MKPLGVSAMGLSLAVALGILATTCGGDSPSDELPSEARTPQGAVESLWRHVAENDWKGAYTLLHPDCQATITRADYAATMAAAFRGIQIESYRVSGTSELESWENGVTGKTYSADLLAVGVEITFAFSRPADSASPLCTVTKAAPASMEQLTGLLEAWRDGCQKAKAAYGVVAARVGEYYRIFAEVCLP